MLPGLQLGDAAGLLGHHRHLLVHARNQIGRIDLDRVDERLIVEQLLRQQRFERLVVGIAVGGVALGAALRRQLTGILVHLGVEDRRTAHHRHDLVEHHLPRLAPGAPDAQHEGREQQTFL